VGRGRTKQQNMQACPPTTTLLNVRPPYGTTRNNRAVLFDHISSKGLRTAPSRMPRAMPTAELGNGYLCGGRGPEAASASYARPAGHCS